jgi:hypothetical protein
MRGSCVCRSMSNFCSVHILYIQHTGTTLTKAPCILATTRPVDKPILTTNKVHRALTLQEAEMLMGWEEDGKATATAIDADDQTRSLDDDVRWRLLGDR